MLEKSMADNPDVRSEDPRIHRPPRPMTISGSSDLVTLLRPLDQPRSVATLNPV